MTGTLHVTTNGTPKRRTPANPAPDPADAAPPDASVQVLDSRISGVLFHGAYASVCARNEPTRFKLVATSGKTRIALGTFVVTDRKRDAKIHLTKKGKRLLFTADSVRLKLSAKVNDAADNRASATATRKLR